MQTKVDQQRFWSQRGRTEVARFRQDAPEHQCCGKGEAANDRQRNPPAEEIGEYTGQQTTAHAADGVTADIQPHRERHHAGMDLFAQVGHADRRHAAQRQTNQGAHNQDPVPAGHHRRQQGAAGSQHQRRHHYLFAANRVRERAGKQQADRQHGGGDGQRDTAAGW